MNYIMNNMKEKNETQIDKLEYLYIFIDVWTVNLFSMAIKKQNINIKNILELNII